MTNRVLLDVENALGLMNRAAGQLFKSIDVGSAEASACLTGRTKFNPLYAEAAQHPRHTRSMDVPPLSEFAGGPEEFVGFVEFRHTLVTSVTNSDTKLILREVPLPLPPLPFTEAEVSELRTLQAEGETALKPRMRRRLMVLIALSQRKNPSQIVQECGISHQGLLNIRNDVRELGVKTQTDAIRASIDSAKTKKNTERRAPGQPPIPTLEAFADRQKPEKEAVIELVSVVFAADVQLVIIGVQTPTAKADSPSDLRKAAELQALIRTAIEKAKEPVRWTGFPFDQEQRYLFNVMRWRYGDTVRLGVTYNPRELPSPLGSRFSPHWSFYVFTSTRTSVTRALIARMMKDRRYKLYQWEREAFFSNIEGVVHQLRMTCNLRGLCPASEGLEKRLWAWKGKSHHFEYHVEPSGIHSHVKRRLAQIAGFAHAGYVFALDLTLVRAIPKRERIPIKIAAVRARVFKRENGPENSSLQYNALPELGYIVPVKTNQADKLKGALRTPGLAPLFEYSVRLQVGQQTSTFPTALLKRLSGKPSGGRSHVALIGLARQFLMPPQPVALGVLKRFSSRDGTKSFRVQVDGKTIPAFCLSCPALLEAIEKAFQRNDYGDSLAALSGWKRRLAASSADPNQPPTGWLWDWTQGIPDIVPPFHFSDDELRGVDTSAITRKRLRVSPVPEFATTATGYERRADGVVYPGYDRQATLRKVYSEFDADFLLRKIDDPTWCSLLENVKAFSELCKAAIFDLVFKQEIRPLRRLLRSAIPPRLRSDGLMQQHQDDLVSWGTDAFHAFQPCPRVLRQAVENIQRFILAGFSPAAVVVYTQEELLRDWKIHLTGYLARKLSKEIQRKMPGSNS